MEAKGFVVAPGQGRVWKMAAGRSSALKLLGGETSEKLGGRDGAGAVPLYLGRSGWVFRGVAAAAPLL
jgi:hypothetical protein